MKKDRWITINQIFHAALDVEPAQRDAVVHAHCDGDPELEAEVSLLLRADEQAGTYLDAPVDLAAFFPPHVSPVTVGDFLCNRFRIVREIAQGGMGQVFEAFDTELAVRIALKVIRPEIASNPEAIGRFRQEVRLARTITHRNICRTFDLERDTLPSGDVVFLTMEFLPGETLASRLQRQGPLPLPEALAMSRQIAGALAAAHALGIVHRDMKPANIMLVPSDTPASGPPRVVVTDFGLARLDPLTIDPVDGHSTFSRTGRPVGTLGYMAPEQLEGSPVSPATDLYAFALILFEMATGERLFKSDNLLTGIAQRLKEPAPSLAEKAPHLPQAWRNAIEAGMRRDPSERPATAEEMLEIVEGKRLAPVPRHASRSYLRILVVAAVLAIAAVSLFYGGLRFTGWKTDAKVAPGALIYLAEVQNLTGEKSLDATTELLRAGLAQSAQVNLLDQARIGDILQQMKQNPETKPTGAVGREVAMRAGAVRVVYAKVAGSKGSYHLDVEIQQPDDTPARYREHWTKSFSWQSAAGARDSTAIPSELLSAVRGANDWIRHEVGESSNDIARLDVPPGDVTTSDWQALADYGYAEKLFAQTKREEAITALEGAVRRDPGFALAHAFMGDIYSNLGYREKGYRAYQQALDADLSGRLSLRERDRIEGMLAFDSWDYQASETAYRDSTLYYQHDYLSWFRRARSLFLMGRTGEAIQCLERAHAVDSSKPVPVVQLTGAHLVLGNDAEVERWLKELEAHYPRDYFLYAKGPVQVVKGQYAEAGQSFEELVRSPLQAFRWAGQAMLANLFAEQGKDEAAIKILSSALESAPDNPLFLMDRSALFCKTRQYDLCMKDLRTALTSDGNSIVVIQASAILGRAIASSSGKPRAELRALLGNLAARPLTRQAGLVAEIEQHRVRGEVLLADGDPTEAVVEMRRAATLYVSNRSREYLARALTVAARKRISTPESDAMLQEAADLYAVVALHPASVWEFSQAYPPGFYADQIEAYLAASHNLPQLASPRAEVARALALLRPSRTSTVGHASAASVPVAARSTSIAAKPF